MVLDFLAEGAPECPLLRFYGERRAEFGLLQSLVLLVAKTGRGVPRLNEFTAIRPVAGCSLTLHLAAADVGVKRLGADLNFQWHLTHEAWLAVADLIDPFTRHVRLGTFQWLAGPQPRGLDYGNIGVLLSASAAGTW